MTTSQFLSLICFSLVIVTLFPYHSHLLVCLHLHCGQSPLLQFSVRLETPLHGKPPNISSCFFSLANVSIPSLQDFEQPWLCHSSHTQSTGHSWVLHDSSTLLSPLQVPPSIASHFFVLVLVLVPPPHSFEHSPSFQSFQPQSLDSQL